MSSKQQDDEQNIKNTLEETASSSNKPGKSNKEHESHHEEDDHSSLSALEALTSFFTQKFKLNRESIDETDETFKILNEISIKGIVEYIKNKQCKNIITMAGAGISTAAGIPDFRSPGSGLYDNLAKYNLPHPQAIFELDYFYENPKPFFVLAKELYPGAFNPTLSHYFIKLLSDKGLLLRHYTQNIDTLERVAGIPEEKLVEAHGTFYTGHCLACHKEYDLEWMKVRIFQDKIPTCQEKKCGGIVKPDIVFFGENLPEKFYNHIKTDFSKCDLLIVMGSSLVVQPFASLVERVPDNCPRLLINREKAGHRSGLMALLGLDGGMDFDNDKNHRDVFWQGNCDDGCKLLANLLGWSEELDNLIKEQKPNNERQKSNENKTAGVSNVKAKEKL